MTIFAILAGDDDSRLNAAIERAFSNNYYKIADRQWLVASPDLTTRDVVQKLGAQDTLGKVLVVSVANYWGYHDRDLWEWLKVKSS
jgi:hypothetical protein